MTSALRICINERKLNQISQNFMALGVNITLASHLQNGRGSRHHPLRAPLCRGLVLSWLSSPPTKYHHRGTCHPPSPPLGSTHSASHSCQVTENWPKGGIAAGRILFICRDLIIHLLAKHNMHISSTLHEFDINTKLFLTWAFSLPSTPCLAEAGLAGVLELVSDKTGFTISWMTSLMLML